MPLTAETEAKIRLGKFLEREGRERIRDGLLEEPPFLSSQGSTLSVGPDEFTLSLTPSEWERILNLGQDFREEIIEWITGVRSLLDFD